MSNGKLSKVQQGIVDLLKSDNGAYIKATKFWDFQDLIFSDGRKTKYFKMSTRKALTYKGVIVEVEPNKFILNNSKTHNQ